MNGPTHCYHLVYSEKVRKMAHRVGLEPSKIAILPTKHSQATFGARAHMGKEVKLMREP